MNIEKYSSYFHDGLIDDVNIVGKEIIFTMSSSQLDDDENEDNINLSRFNEIRGRLHLLNPKNILINDAVASYDDLKYTFGDILHLGFSPRQVVLNVSWYIDEKNTTFQNIIFDSSHYYFENIPDLRLLEDWDFDDEGRPTRLQNP